MFVCSFVHLEKGVLFMKKAMLLTGALLIFCAGQIAGQAALNYDPYYVLPGKSKSLGLDLALISPDVVEIADRSDIDLMGKYSINDQLEAGMRLTFGFLNDGADSFSSITLGAKYALAEERAITLNLTPFNEAEELGLSLGIMNSVETKYCGLNKQLQIGLLDAYAPVGIGVEALIQPVRELNDLIKINQKLVGYLDILIATNTDGIGDNLSVIVGPKVDIAVAEGWMVNAGISFSMLSGDLAPDTDLGVTVALLRNLTLE